jgi:hypothetical protein
MNDLDAPLFCCLEIDRDLVAWISSMNAVIPGLLGFI